LLTNRWGIENWWRWLKRLYKVKEPLGRRGNALLLQIVAVFWGMLTDRCHGMLQFLKLEENSCMETYNRFY
jgi:hypothetical protein